MEWVQNREPERSRVTSYLYYKLHIIIMCTEKVEFLTDDIAGNFTWVHLPNCLFCDNCVRSKTDPFSLGRLSKIQC